MKWSQWRAYFERNRAAARVTVHDDTPIEGPELRSCLARTFSVFQLGEAGEGRIAKEAWHFDSPTVDDDWRVALGHWVREEGRHGRVLGDCARVLGGRPIAKNWTNSLLVFGRRMLGIRLKLLVVLSAEVIGITFYGLIARALPAGSIRTALEAIAQEEVQHLAFHVLFFQHQTGSGWRRALFWVAWLAVGTAAGAVVLVDHAATLRRLGIGRMRAARAFLGLVMQTGQRITRPSRTRLEVVEVSR